MDKIRVLPDGVANQIAAGEVVGRPAAVVKELMENAVDAGSSSVTVNFKDGGKGLIQVIDDGCGMSETDARLAFERHATSKIRSTEDLYNLNSFGFRGEAMPSISSVSELELRSRTETMDVGTQVTINGGTFQAQEPVQTPKGTRIWVKNLFYNVPARRKFLKEGHIEARHIMAEFQRVVLCNPQIAFMLYNNDSLVYDLKPGNLRQRIAGVHGKALANNLLDVSVDTSIAKVEGFVGHPSIAKKTNKEQYLFVNGRYFRSPYFHKAILKSYEKLIATDTQPAYFLHFRIDPQRIDVNVHPSKTEIKFDDEQAIWQIVHAAVRESLGKLGVVPMMDFDVDESIEIPVYKQGVHYKIPDTGFNPQFNPFEKNPASAASSVSGRSAKPTALDGWQGLYEIDSKASEDELIEFIQGSPGTSDESSPNEPLIEYISEESAQQPLFEVDSQANVRGLLKISGRLYATTIGDALAIVDVIRAHECVLYERYRTMLSNHTSVSQQILFPDTLEFDAEDTAVLEAMQEDLQALGFEYTQEKGQLVFTGLPAELTTGALADTIRELIDLSRETAVDSAEEMQNRQAAILARKTAQSSRQHFAESAVEPLLHDWMQCENKNYTPEGLPVLTCFTPDELNKRLKAR